MKATEVVFDREPRAVRAVGPTYGGGESGDEPVLVAHADDIDIVAAEDIRVRTRGETVLVESLGDRPLLLRWAPNTDRRVMRIRTEFEPDAEVEIGGLKDGQPISPPDR